MELNSALKTLCRGGTLRAEVVERQDVALIRLSGHIIAGPASQMIRNLVEQSLRARRRGVVLDLGAVSEIDSSGLGELISAHVRLGRAGAALRVCGLNDGLRSLLVLTKLVTTLTVCDSEHTAVAEILAQA